MSLALHFSTLGKMRNLLRTDGINIFLRHKLEMLKCSSLASNFIS